jgi:hypothetical protein
MKIDIIKKLKSVGGIEKNLDCTDDKKHKEGGFLNIEKMFNSRLPQSYKDFYAKVGAFSFLELVCVQCIDKKAFILRGNKVSVGNFYCITGNDELSINKILLTFQEQLPIGVLPICEGELGDHICMSLRKDDFESIYYFNHESPPDSDLFLIAKSFEDFITGLEIYKGDSSDEELVKKMKAEYSTELIALLKKSGYELKK